VFPHQDALCLSLSARALPSGRLFRVATRLLRAVDLVHLRPRRLLADDDDDDDGDGHGEHGDEADGANCDGGSCGEGGHTAEAPARAKRTPETATAGAADVQGGDMDAPKEGSAVEGSKARG